MSSGRRWGRQFGLRFRHNPVQQFRQIPLRVSFEWWLPLADSRNRPWSQLALEIEIMNRHQIEVRAADPPARLPNLVPVPGHGMNINRRKRCLASAPDSDFFHITRNLRIISRNQSGHRAWSMSLSKWPEPRSTMATCSIKLQLFKKLPGTELPSGMAVLPEQILVAELVEVTRNLMK